jgi:Zn-dependent peptidase ImmA (M78 family)
MKSRADSPDEARSVNRYAAAILMPRAVIIDEAKKIDRTRWPNLYRLAERFDVTISALRVRLEQFNLLYLDQETKRLYPSREDAQGQARLQF